MTADTLTCLPRTGAPRVLVVAAGILAGCLAGTVMAADCGTTIIEDLGSDAFAAPAGCGGIALTLVGPARLDLTGQTLSCDGSFDSVGISLLGAGAQLTGGVVENCGVGVLVEGEGGHRVAGLTASGNGEPHRESGGFDVRSDHNRLVEVSATGNGHYGIRIDGNDNRVRRSDASNNQWFGIVVFGERNRVRRSSANQNEDANIVISNRIGSGAALHGGGDGNVVALSEANGSRSNDGIYVAGDRNVIRGNQANDNFADGIDIYFTGHDNRIAGNTALNNHAAADTEVEDFAGIDLEDRNPECDANEWLDNTFATSIADDEENPACIQ